MLTTPRRKLLKASSSTPFSRSPHRSCQLWCTTCLTATGTSHSHLHDTYPHSHPNHLSSAALASNGEICCAAQTNADGTCNFLDNSDECKHGLRDYKRNYIDEIAKTIRKYCRRVPMALIIEPDSLPNLVTNLENPRCGGRATQTSYKKGIPYAIRKLSHACPRATMYLDAAHGAWLGWQDNQEKFTELVKSLKITKYLRGFTLNVSNYNLLGKRCPSVGFCLHEGNSTHACCEDPCNLIAASNPSHSELNYAMALHGTMTKLIPKFEPHMIIDTSRNAVAPREACSSWCNARGAGAGALPTVHTDYPEVVDAYMWVKIPGASDGCTEQLPDGGGKCPRFDKACASDDSIGSEPGEPRCPEAGDWFDYQAKMLARNAKFD